MPQTFKIKNSSVKDKAPAAGDLATAELALNLKDQKLYSKDADGTVFEIGAEQDLSNYVRLDPNGVRESIYGNQGLAFGDSMVVLPQGIECENDFAHLYLVNAFDTASYFKADNSQTVVGDNKIVLAVATGNAEFAGSVDVGDFGTSTVQKGNVAPLNDWSCYPARTNVSYSQPVPPAPAPEPIDPDFGVDEPTFSGDIASDGLVGTQDVVDLEGE